VIINKFNPNLVLVNINKLKPYQFVEDSTLQPILVKPNDLLPKELVETNKFCNLFIKETIKMNTNDLLMKELIEVEPNIPITIYITSSRHETKSMHPSSLKAFQINQERDLKHLSSMGFISTKQNKTNK
jgi:hypothetical protein